MNDVRLPDVPGTYALVLYSQTGGMLRIGALGLRAVPPGWYVYVGSALGPGGLRARVGHHLRPTVRPRWHIDYLRKTAELRAIWFVCGIERREHDWARAFSAGWERGLPVEGFGCSDCRCPAHLFRGARRPIRAAFDRALRGTDPGHPRLRVQFVSRAAPYRRATEKRNSGD